MSDHINHAAAGTAQVKPWMERTNDTTPNAIMMAMEQEIADLHAQLAQQGQGEPVAWRYRLHDKEGFAPDQWNVTADPTWAKRMGHAWHIEPLYLAPPASAQPADDEQVLALHRQLAAEKLRADQGWQRADAKSRECIELRERIAAPQQPAARAAVPDGYALVPKVPTPEMLHAAYITENCGHGDRHFSNAYRAMLAASPATLTAPAQRDWTEDYAGGENQYECKCSTCGNAFFGHKRRVTCKACATLAEPAAAADVLDSMADGLRVMLLGMGKRVSEGASRNMAEALLSKISFAAPAAQQAAPNIDNDEFWNHVIAYCKGVGNEGQALVDYVMSWHRAALVGAAPATAGTVGLDAKDAALLDFLDTNAHFNMGWSVKAAPVGNLSVQSIIMGGKPIREAIREAMRAQQKESDRA